MDIKFRLNRSRIPHQGLFWKASSRQKALITGYGGGKTKIGAAEIIKHSIQDPGLYHMAVSPTFPMAKKTIIPTIIETLEQNFDPPLLEDRDWTYNKSDHFFHIKAWNGRIWVGSGDNPASLKGPNLASYWLDEPGLMDKMVHKEMIGRLRAPGAKNPQGFLTGTPEGFNYLQELCEGDTKPKEMTVIRGKTTDNPYLPEAYVATLLDQYDEQLVRAYINGEFVNMAGGNAYYSFSEANKLNSFTPDASRAVHMAMDFNYDPMCSTLSQDAVIDGRPSVVVFQEFAFHNCNTDSACERVQEWLRETHGKEFRIEASLDPTDYLIYPDPACQSRNAHGVGKSDLALIRQAFTGKNAHVYVKPAAPKRKDRLNAVNAKLKNAYGHRTLYVTRNCKTLIRDFNAVTMEEFLNGNFKDPSLGHITDALGYQIDFRYPVISGGGRHTRTGGPSH